METALSTLSSLLNCGDTRRTSMASGHFHLAMLWGRRGVSLTIPTCRKRWVFYFGKLPSKSAFLRTDNKIRPCLPFSDMPSPSAHPPSTRQWSTGVSFRWQGANFPVWDYRLVLNAVCPETTCSVCLLSSLSNDALSIYQGVQHNAVLLPVTSEVFHQICSFHETNIYTTHIYFTERGRHIIYYAVQRNVRRCVVITTST